MNSSELNASVDALADQAIRTARAGDLRTGLGLARHAVHLGRTEGDVAHLCALNALGLVQGACGMFIESIASCIDASALAVRLKDTRGVLHAAVTAAGAGTFILEAGSVTESLLARCTVESERLADDALLVRIDNTYGIYYLNLKRFDDGIAAYERALLRCGAPAGRAWLYTPTYLVSGNLAFLHVQRALAAPPETHAAMVSSARERIDAALHVAGEFNNADAEARALFGKGVLLSHLRDFETALAAFDRALLLARQIGHQPRMVDTLTEIGKTRHAMKELEAAVEALDDAFAIAGNIRPTMRIPRICDELAAAYGDAGKTREAAHYQAMAEKERRSLEIESAHAIRDLTAFERNLEFPGG
jgi:tetratricopeptide (TPR) repeat protein